MLSSRLFVNHDTRLYYGDADRFDSIDYRYYSLLIQTSFTDAGCIQFKSVAELDRYRTMMDEVKRRIDVVANQRRDRHISEAQFKTFLRQEWIPLTDEFISQWSQSLVPVDIRDAIDDIRKNVDLPAFEWPALRRLRKGTDGEWQLDPLE